MKKRRNITTASLTTPEQSIDIQTLINRSVKGLPINTKLRQHQPFPPDGEDPEDFETGTEEYLDLNDVQRLSERIEDAQNKLKEQQTEKKKKDSETKFNKAVEEEVAKRLQAAQAAL